jgi:hypothetical protein
MLETDDHASAAEAAGMFHGEGVAQFYDDTQALGWAYVRHVFPGAHRAAYASLPEDHFLREERSPDEEQPAWDIYMLYPPGPTWGALPPAPRWWIRQVGLDNRGESIFWADDFRRPPSSGDLRQAMRAMVERGRAGVGGGATTAPAG